MKRRDFLEGAALSIVGSTVGSSLSAQTADEEPEATVDRRLAFTEAEYRSRVAKVQSAMAEKRLDALLCYNMASICYLTGLESIAAHKYWLCVVPAHGDPLLLMQDFESHNASLSSWIDRIETYALFADPVNATRNILTAHQLDDGRLGIELGALSSLSTQDYLRLSRMIPAAELIDATDVVPCAATIKSPAEISYLREAGRISSLAMQAAINVVSEGTTDNDIAAVAAETLIHEGSEYMCYQPIVTVGPRSGVPHSTFQRIPIRRGDPVFMEFGACVRRYSSPIMRTAVVGKPSSKMREMFDHCLISVNTSIANLKAGAVTGEVAAASERAIGPLPEGWVWHGYYAYSIGLGFPPEWADCGEIDVVKGNKTVLAPGMVFHCSTSIRDPGKMGTTCSETVVITNDGCEVLTNLPRELFVR
ncbi:MAG: Xaa-Pro peptidase family protein [Planctomycetota bacterium]|nr:Xaa-Pro peptidase family protein [Planctomycetota bacterium]